MNSYQSPLLYAKPVSVLSHCVSMGRVPDACGYGCFVSLPLFRKKNVRDVNRITKIFANFAA